MKFPLGLYSSTNLNLKINQIEYKKNILNNQIARSLRLFSNPKSLKNYDIEFDTKTERRIVSKNSKGTPEVYEIKIILNLDIFPLIYSFLSIILFIFKKHALLDKFVVLIKIESLVFLRGEILLL